jgi:L-ribulose-5-phosphate 3-epimerase
MGSVQNDLHLRRKEVQNAWIKESQRTGVKISSLAIGELNNVPYKSDPRTREWVWDSVDVAANLRVSVVLLAFFVKNDLRNDEKGIKEVISRLKEVAPHAEKRGITLGIESYLNAEEHLDILERVGSPNVKVYMDFRNTADAGFDAVKEAKRIGTSNICELHMKENGSLLGQGSMPWNDVRDLVYEINCYGDGWMQIEGAIPESGDVITSYKHNLKFLRELFSRSL